MAKLLTKLPPNAGPSSNYPSPSKVSYNLTLSRFSHSDVILNPVGVKDPVLFPAEQSCNSCRHAEHDHGNLDQFCRDKGKHIFLAMKFPGCDSQEYKVDYSALTPKSDGCCFTGNLLVYRNDL